ncbi:MAG: hypothetical protein U0325_07840 [Polyangiales bacterium]
MPGATVVFQREHELLRALLARRSLRRGWDGAAAQLLASLPPTPLDLHIYLEARCDQACEFCAQPAQRDRPAHRVVRALDLALDAGVGDLVRSGALAALLAACARRDPAVRLTLTGHDWLAHPARDALLALLEAHPTLPTRLLGPSTALADAALARRVAALPNLVAVALTVQGGDARTHDRSVGRSGAFDDLCAAVAHLTAAGATVEVNTVLTRDGLDALPSTLAWAQARGLSVTLAAFVPEPGHPSPRAYLPRLDGVRATLAAQVDALATRRALLVGLPLCVVPAPLRSRAFGGARPSTPAAAPCVGCAARARCPGAPQAYLDVFGDDALRPLDAR